MATIAAATRKKWGFIGCGHLAQALIQGALAKNLLSPSQIAAIDHDPKKLKDFARRIEGLNLTQSGSAETLTIAASIGQLVDCCDVILIATKPQDILQPLKELGVHAGENKIIVSLAAGVNGTLLEKFLVKPRVIARVMANTAATIQKGVFGIHFVRNGDEDADAKITDFFGALGQVILVNEDGDIDVVTSGSASGIGFVFSFMEEFEKFFLRKGFDAEDARTMVIETFSGAAEFAKARPEVTLSTLREQVTSKKGTTAAGLTAMKKAGVQTGLKSGLDAAYKRSREIAKSLLNLAKKA
jgi:pyrroline-5-carboxylate reductase